MLDNVGVVVILVLVVLVLTAIFLIMAVTMERKNNTKRFYLYPSEEKILSELTEEDWTLDFTTDNDGYVEGSVSLLDRVELVSKFLDILHEKESVRPR